MRDRLTNVLEGEGLAALVGTAPANVAYVTGFRSLGQSVFRNPRFAVFAGTGTALVVPAVDLPAIVVEGIEVDHVTCFGGFVTSYAEPPGPNETRMRALGEARSPSPADALGAALSALGVTEGTVGIDESQVVPPLWDRLGARLGAIKIVPAMGRFLVARRVKSPWELESMQRALHVAEEALNGVIQMLKPGTTEREAATVYEGEVVKRGAAPYGVVVAFGERSAMPDPWPSDRALRRGDLVRFDVGCVVKGYHAEVARTAVMGEPTQRQEAAHAAIQAGLEAVLAVIKPGVTAGRVHEAAVAATRERGLPDFRRYHVGHGIGLEPYERPKLHAGNDTALEAGEVLRVETPYYLQGWAGPNVKETVLVAQTGARALNRSARGLVVLD